MRAMKRSPHEVVVIEEDKDEKKQKLSFSGANYEGVKSVPVDISTPGCLAIPSSGRRARRKFISRCLELIKSNHAAQFNVTYDDDFLRQQIYESACQLFGADIDFTNDIIISQVVLRCANLLQNGLEKETASNEDVEIVHVPPDDAVSALSNLKLKTFDTEDDIVAEVLKIFPAASRAFIISLLDTHSMATTDLTSNEPYVRYSYDAFYKIVTEMTEKGYEKEERKNQISSNNVTYNGWSKDFQSSSWDTTPYYRAQAMCLLQRDFPFLKNKSLEKYFEKTGKYHYFLTVAAIEKALGIPRVKKHPVPKSIEATMRNDLKAKKDSLLKANLDTKLRWHLVNDIDKVVDDVTLTEEIEFLEHSEMKNQENKDREIAEKMNEEIAEKEGSLFECGCCCGEYAFEMLIQCSEGHLFCRNCLQRYIENELFGNGKTRLNCMSSAEGEPCPGKYSETFVKKALPDKVYEKFQDAVAKEAVKEANINDLLECHNCGYQVELSSDAGNVLSCPACFAQTCRHCKEEAHIPLRCEEVEKKSMTSFRVGIEEAMSEARIRECPNPKCKRRFYKTEGCNKMTCSCGRKICYICRKDISKEGYRHFCNVPHCQHKNCGNCQLFTNSIQDDRQAMYDAGIKKLQENKLSENDSHPSENKQSAESATEFNINSLLEGGTLKASKNVGPPTRNRNNVIARHHIGRI